MKKILIVDDEEAVRDVLGRLFHASQFDVIVSENGMDGLEKARALMPDLIISDVLMPGLDGIGLCAAIKNDPKTKNIRFLFISTQSKMGDVEFALEHAPDGYISKPFDLTRIIKKVHRLLEDLSENSKSST